MQKNMTSEEKLLQLIRKKKPPSAGASSAVPSVAVPVSAGLSLSEEFALLKGASRALFVVSGLLLVYIVFQLAAAQNKRSFAGDQPLAVEGAEAAGPAVLSPAEAYEEYAAVWDKRDLFSDAVKKDPGTVGDAAMPPAPAQPPVDLARDYKVVGIFLDKDPRVAIENLQSHRTVFLSRGDELEGCVLDDIRDGRVIFTVSGQTIELNP